MKTIKTKMKIWFLEIQLITEGSKICIWQIVDFTILLHLILTSYILEVHEKSDNDDNSNNKTMTGLRDDEELRKRSSSSKNQCKVKED